MTMHERRREITVPGIQPGWTVEYVETRGYDSPDKEWVAKHKDYPTVSIGVNQRRGQGADFTELLQRIEEVQTPDKITHAQWLNIGRKHGWL